MSLTWLLSGPGEIHHHKQGFYITSPTSLARPRWDWMSWTTWPDNSPQQAAPADGSSSLQLHGPGCHRGLPPLTELPPQTKTAGLISFCSCVRNCAATACKGKIQLRLCQLCQWSLRRSWGVNTQEKQNNEVMSTGVWSVWGPGLHTDAFIVRLYY